MVCVPCFIVPVLLYLWHKFVQPVLLKYWNPWEKKDKDGNIIKTEPKNPFDCSDGVCRFAGKKSTAIKDSNSPPATTFDETSDVPVEASKKAV
ncbi:UPF0729 protein AGAP000931 [Anopheles maculipalpis]|uniref:UPF0729 protein AGAP000931 n=1 Tax=Anopheles maculipalpis TaxID=1496333 RepID=UPI002158A7D5|nr:UPF0729 protein AGAP000931 [Anopheles maculipalpis]